MVYRNDATNLLSLDSVPHTIQSRKTDQDESVENRRSEMSTFVNAVVNQSARTENGMKARQSTANAVTDLFFKIGAMRGQNVIPAWTAAKVQNPELATRVALWARDVRGGAGERKIFRDILVDLANSDKSRAIALGRKVPELGRWDDLLVLVGTDLETFAFEEIRIALEDSNGLCAKWMPRQGPVAAKLRAHLGWTPKFYRKRLVELTKVVETQMCAKDWDNINFNHVPSVASARYKKAFSRHTEKYKEWTAALVSKDPEVQKTVKVNAGAVYPYDVLKGVINHYGQYGVANLDHIVAQWDALPNYVGDANVLPLVDVSGSMTSLAGGWQSKSGVTCLEVAVSLGLYLADKNTGKFKDTFLTFSSSPQLLHLKGNILDKCKQMISSKWEMSTNLHRAFDKILQTAVEGNVPQSEMPGMLLILSDMQFDSCTRFDDSAMEMIARKYIDNAYNVPNIVFWNLNAHDNVPAKFDEKGVALVSGFSPAIVKGVLAADLDDFTPEAIMLKTIMSERYDY
jgi:hypothetical protein